VTVGGQAEEHTWELAAHHLLDAGMTGAGMTGAEATRQLSLHAPTAATFAAGVYEIEPDPQRAFPAAAREATSTDLAALSERSPRPCCRSSELTTSTRSCVTRSASRLNLRQRRESRADEELLAALDAAGAARDGVRLESDGRE
jgi:hypothetical protein